MKPATQAKPCSASTSALRYEHVAAPRTRLAGAVRPGSRIGVASGVASEPMITTAQSSPAATAARAENHGRSTGHGAVCQRTNVARVRRAP
jgi:hypothetical protein